MNDAYCVAHFGIRFASISRLLEAVIIFNKFYYD